MLRAAVPLALSVLLVACASAPPQLELAARGEADVVWPAPPEQPRYRYLGVLTGEENFVRDPATTSIGRRVFEWIVGLGGRYRRPDVLQRPMAGYTDTAGRIYVADVSRAAVFVFDEAMGRIKVWGMAGPRERFESPVAITAGPHDQILVSDADLGRIVRLDREGRPIGSIDSATLQRPTGIAYDAQGRHIYVADAYAHDIEVFDEDGRLVQTIGRRGEGEGEFNAPTYLCFHAGRLYVTDTLNSRIQVLSADGRFIRSFGRRGLFVGDLPRPKGVTVDSAGHVYVVESYYDYLLVFDDRGRFLLPIGGSGSGIGQFYLPAGVWADDQDRIYIADAFNGRVVILQFLGGS